MTAALIFGSREQNKGRTASAVHAEPEVIVRARMGDAAALSGLFDSIAPELYGQLLSWTKEQQEAERLTGKAAARLPRVLRSQRWDSVESLASYLVSTTRSELATVRRGLDRSESRRDLRAMSRHFFLASTSIATAVYATVLAL